MMTIRVFCIVEGHGDVTSFPILIRRICNEIFGEYGVTVEQPYRLPKGRITKEEHLLPVAQFGVARLRENATAGDRLLLLVSRDADEECPLEVAKAISDIIAAVDGAELCKAVVPNEEFEAWLLAGAGPLATHPDCNPEAYLVADADALRSPKSIFAHQILKPDRTYSETVDQPKFTAQFELTDSTFQRSRSLRRLRDVIERSLLG